MNELVSIIIPVYNYGQFLGAAIDSVMKQSYRPIE
ncbi:MAG: glycosyltransferase, partial [Bacteroidales bacterium]